MTTALRRDYGSWGGTLRAEHRVERPSSANRVARLLASSDVPVLAFGCGRSYGDVALNPSGMLIDCTGLDRFVSFDVETGVVVCEAGVQLATILEHVCRAAGSSGFWFLPVSPGTRFVSVGGAIANDVHGKNHHAFGTIGRHILWLDLVRSDGATLRCSSHENGALFAATIGGLGLTGVIVRAALLLRRVVGLRLETEHLRFHSVGEFFEIARESESAWEYSAAWVDCGGRSAGRGIFSRARHVAGDVNLALGAPRVSFPVSPRWSLVNASSVTVFNALYFHKFGSASVRRSIEPYASVLYPLDAIGGWNRVYGTNGFYQFQCVVPPAGAAASIDELLSVIGASGEGSALSVLKTFGDVQSPALMSFARVGTTLALDFPNRGTRTLDLLSKLERIVTTAGGALYPAKDAVMSAATFLAGYPNSAAFRKHIDPKISSAFARRVGLIPHDGAAA